MAGIECAQVDRCHTLTVPKHTIHVEHLLSVEFAQVDSCHLRAIIEHLAHVSHLTGVEILNLTKFFKIAHALKPFGSALRTSIGKGIVKVYLHDR